ncbi:MAG TPA: acetyl-CoA carboxylase biotin carboxyl carrier protein subunit [Bacteroidales bacterium]|nr:acetyl-CoA carboxylase biotin carboxyl carrier protein subunit [Bacteroidales bacterium]HPT02741.1 acetyl-CoA carboxylase biotin carboxyl carrier protein subunit [Bacteroidales bacterium]
MEEKSKEQQINPLPEEPQAEEVLQSLTIEDVRYKTRLNKKFLARKNYQPRDPKEIIAFIPGTVINVFIKKGSKVKQGEKLLELEAMKMVNTLFAPADGVVKDLLVKTGDLVSKNQVLMHFK